MTSPEYKRSVLLPILQGVVWVSSIGVSVFFDFGGSYPSTSVVRKLLVFVIITIFFEVLLVLFDIKYALKGYVIDKDLAWVLQTRTIPLLICVSCSVVPAFLFAGYISITSLIISCGAFKSGLLHSVSVIDAKKIEDYNIRIERH